MHIRNFGAGEKIVVEGEPGDSMYIIRSGACQATKMEVNNRVKMLSSMKTGDFFGEISLLTGENRTATIVASEDISLIVIGKNDFASVVGSSSLISEQIAQVVLDRQKNQGVLLDDYDDMAKVSQRFIKRISDFFRI